MEGTTTQVADTITKLAPQGVVLGGGYFLGISWEEWVYVLTAIYTAAQLVWFVVEKFSIVKEKRRKQRVK